MTTLIAAVKTARAIAYIRVSTPNQVGERHVSLDTQQSRFTEHCTTKGYHPVGSFSDVASGRKDSRRGYQQLLEFVRAGGADVVVTQYLDRFGRKPREILQRIWELEGKGIRIEVTDEDIREELVLLVRAGLAGAESKRTSERIRANICRRVAVGVKFGVPPFGFQGVRGGPDTKGRSRVESFTQVPTEAAVVRVMFRLTVVENMGAKRIADTLNGEGHRTRKGNPWATASVLQVLYNEANVGRLVYGRRPAKGNEPKGVVVVEGVYPPIFTAEEWDSLQRRRGIHRELAHGRSRSSPYLLSGFARCGECGAALAGKVSSSRGRKSRRYVCSARHGSRAACPGGRTHDAAALEAAILEHLGQYSDPDMVRQLLEVQGQGSDTRGEADLAQVSSRLAELEQGFLNDLERVDRGIMTEAEYLKRQEARRQEQDGLQSRKAHLEASVAAQRDMEAQARAVPVRVRSFLEDFQGMDVRQAKAILQGIVKAAHVFNDGRIELEFR